MAKAFSIASWNIEHFGALDKEKKKIVKDPKPIIDLLKAKNADIVAIYEVRSDRVFRYLVESMPDHRFFITEGPQMQEILVGIRKSVPVFLTQKTEFKAGQMTLRPGMLVTPYVDNEYYPLLFLHVKSMRDPKGFGLRWEMTKRAFDFRKVLKKASPTGSNANYIFMGDMNTMGMDYTGRNFDISGSDEISELRRAAKARGMKLLDKTSPATYWHPTYGRSDLDHVVAAGHLKFKQFAGKDVQVSGWTEYSTDAEIEAWTKSYSDHAILYIEVQKV